MKLPRRRFLHLAAGAALLPAVSRVARAQSYPTRPVRLIAPFPPGGSIDLTARLIGQWLSDRLGQQFVIENRPGAGGNIGSGQVLNSTPDGYTILLCSDANAISATLYEKLDYNFLDTAPVAGISRAPNVMVVHPSVPAKTVPEFIAYAKANPGKINMASSGNATPLHVAGELFQMMAGVKLVHVAYRGEPVARPDLLSGQVHVMFGVVPSSLPYIKNGQTRALATSAITRLDVLPDVPAMHEFLPGYEASGWYGISAPLGTPAEIVERLNKDINAGLADAKTKARLGDLGCLVSAGSPADYAKFVTGETDKWGKVVRAAGLKAE